MPLIDGVAIANKINAKSAKRAAALRSAGVTPYLAILQIGSDPASESYTSIKRRTALQVGVECVIEKLPTTITDDEVISIIKKLNGDDAVHGILLQLPLPKKFNTLELCSAIAEKKDIDCLSSTSLASLA